MARKTSKAKWLLAWISIIYVSLFSLQLFVSTRILGGFPLTEHSVRSDFFQSKDGKPGTKYLQYFVQAGWSNQVICLKHAYEIALATDRGLVLSPVVPHFQFYMRDVMDVNDRNFKLQYDLKDAYLRKLSRTNYIPLGNILDLETSLPGLVSKVDFREFYQRRSVAKMNSWAMEANATHFNTHWIRNQPDLDGTQEQIDAVEHQHRLRYSRTFRDIEDFSDANAFGKYPIWTLFDSYRITLHKSVYSDREKTSFRPRFQTKILAASQAIQKDRWHGIPYASVHIRGSDGKFKKKRKDAIQRVLNEAIWEIDAWLKQHQDVKKQAIGLFVATDIADLRQDAYFQERTSLQKKMLREAHGIELKVLFSDDGPANEEDVKALFDQNNSGWVGYPGIFLDQQLAACARIGFVGTKESTFSSFIEELRTDNLAETCGQEFLS